MKKPILLFLFIGLFQVSLAQPPSYFVDTWYLHSFYYNNQEVFIENLEIPEGPSITFQNDYTLQGSAFCNDFSGTFEYISNAPFAIPDNFYARDIVRDFNDCEDLESMENHYFAPLVGEMIAEITSGPSTIGNFLVLQFGSFGYHYYKDYPALGIPGNKLQNIVLFPNPSQDKLFIKSSLNNFDSIVITDFNGRIVSKNISGLNEIDISNLNSGMYFITIESSEGNVTKKFIKN